jgi:NO-binding membrane sensor protein with MHYT domain
LIYFALGALWFSNVLFARPWQRSIGWDPAQRPPPQNATFYVVPLLTYLVIATAVAMLASATGSDTLGEGVVLGLVIGIGLAAMHSLGDAVFDPNKPRPYVWFAITAGYHVVGILIVAVLVSVWR